MKWLWNEIIRQHIIVEEEIKNLDVRKAKVDIARGKEKLRKIRIGGVDGGAVERSFLACTLLFWRAVGVVIEYKQSKIISTCYFPHRAPEVKAEIYTGENAQIELSLLRSIEEKRRALELLDDVDILFLDGSLLAHPAHGLGSEALQKEEKELILKLLQKAERQGVAICGVIKDTHSEEWAKQLGTRVKDVVLANSLLEPCEYFQPIDLQQSNMCVKTTFLKLSPHEFPIRLELFNADEEHLALTAYLSALAPSKSQPPVLIEADLRARIPENHPALTSFKFHPLLQRRMLRRFL